MNVKIMPELIVVLVQVEDVQLLAEEVTRFFEN
jgi:hypothetical protein